MVRLGATRRFSVFGMLDIKQQEYRGRIQIDRQRDNDAFDSIFLNTNALNIDENRRKIISIDGSLEFLPDVSIDILIEKGYEAIRSDLASHYDCKFPVRIKLTKDVEDDLPNIPKFPQTDIVGSVVMDNATQNLI
jgi:hypothetical protein